MGQAGIAVLDRVRSSRAVAPRAARLCPPSAPLRMSALPAPRGTMRDWPGLATNLDGIPPVGDTSSHFFSTLILLVFPAFAVISQICFPPPSCDYGDVGIQPFAMRRLALIRLPAFPLVPTRSFHKKSFILNGSASENRLGPSGSQEVT